MLREILTGVSRIAVLFQPSDPIPAHWRELKRLQPVLGLSVQRVPVGRVEEPDAAFETVVRGRAQALLVFPTNRLIAEPVRIADLARRHRVATVFEFSHHVGADGLLSYGGSIGEWIGETLPMYVDKVLKGTKPGELPILQSTRFILGVNLKTARMLGIDIPRAILGRADLVIE